MLFPEVRAAAVVSTGAEEQEQPDTGVQVLEKDKEDEAVESPWRIILYNDEIHSFDEVINQLLKALGCSESHAKELTFKVHNDGKANVFEGSFEECFKKNSVLKEIQLITEIKG